jgi:hypothetical protein
MNVLVRNYNYELTMSHKTYHRGMQIFNISEIRNPNAKIKYATDFK